MPTGSFVGFGHALHRWLSGLVMANHDSPFSRRQEQLGDLCTNPPWRRNAGGAVSYSGGADVASTWLATAYRSRDAVLDQRAPGDGAALRTMHALPAPVSAEPVWPRTPWTRGQLPTPPCPPAEGRVQGDGVGASAAAPSGGAPVVSSRGEPQRRGSAQRLRPGPRGRGYSMGTTTGAGYSCA